jgi:hypothetical protein
VVVQFRFHFIYSSDIMYRVRDVTKTFFRIKRLSRRSRLTNSFDISRAEDHEHRRLDIGRAVADSASERFLRNARSPGVRRTRNRSSNSAFDNFRLDQTTYTTHTQPKYNQAHQTTRIVNVLPFLSRDDSS